MYMCYIVTNYINFYYHCHLRMIVYMYRKFVFFSQRKVTIVMYMYITLKAIISCSMYTLKIYIYNIIWLISYTYTIYDMYEYMYKRVYTS